MQRQESDFSELNQNLRYYQIADDDLKPYFAFRVLDILYNFQNQSDTQIDDDGIAELFPGKDVNNQRRVINRLRNGLLYNEGLVIQDNQVGNYINSTMEELIKSRNIEDDISLSPIDKKLIQTQIKFIRQGVELIKGDSGLMARFNIRYDNSEQDIYEVAIEELEKEINDYRDADDEFSRVTDLDSKKIKKVLLKFKDFRNQLVHEDPEYLIQDKFSKYLKGIQRTIQELDKFKLSKEKGEERKAEFLQEEEKDKKEKSEELRRQETAIKISISRISSNEDYADEELDFTISQNIDRNQAEFISTATSKSPEALRAALLSFAASNKTKLLSPIQVKGVHFAGLFIKKSLENKEGDLQNSYTVVYADPSGMDSIPDHVSRAINEALGIKKEDIIVTSNQIQSYKLLVGSKNVKVGAFEFNNRHCGAFVSFILSGLENGEIKLEGSQIQINIGYKENYDWQNINDLTKSQSDAFGKSIRDYHTKLLSGQDLALDENPINILKVIFREGIGKKNQPLIPKNKKIEEAEIELRKLQQKVAAAKAEIKDEVSEIAKILTSVNQNFLSMHDENNNFLEKNIISFPSEYIDLLEKESKLNTQEITSKAKDTKLRNNTVELEKSLLSGFYIEDSDAKKVKADKEELGRLLKKSQLIHKLTERLKSLKKRLPDINASINSDELVISEIENSLKKKSAEIDDLGNLNSIELKSQNLGQGVLEDIGRGSPENVSNVVAITKQSDDIPELPSNDLEEAALKFDEDKKEENKKEIAPNPPENQDDILARFDPLASSDSSQNISTSEQNDFLASIFGVGQQNPDNQEIPSRSPSPERKAEQLLNNGGKER